MKSTTAPDDGDLLLDLALDLTAALSSDDRHRRLVEAVRRMLPCDAAALLRLDGDALVPVATHGLAPETMGRRFARDEHPRLDAINTLGCLLHHIDVTRVDHVERRQNVARCHLRFPPEYHRQPPLVEAILPRKCRRLK